MSLHCVPTDLCRLARIGALLVLHQFESKKKDTDTKKTGDAQGPFTPNLSFGVTSFASNGTRGKPCTNSLILSLEEAIRMATRDYYL